MTIEQIRNTTEADFNALPAPRIGFYYDPDRSPDYMTYKCAYGWPSSEADGETYSYTIKMNDPDLIRHTLHLKGIHAFHAKTPQDPWVIDRIKKGYITDSGTNILTTNSDGYWTYAPSSGISIGV